MNPRHPSSNGPELFSDSQRKPLKTLFRVLNKDLPRIILAMFVFVVKHSPAWAFPIVTASMVNILAVYLENGFFDFQLLIINSIVLLILIFQNLMTHPLYIRFVSKTVRKLETELRNSMVLRIQYMAFLAQTRFKKGAFQSKILRDVEAISSMLVQGLNGLFPAIVTIIIALSMTIARQPLIALFYVVTVPIAVIIRSVYQGRINSGNSDFRSELEKMSSLVSDMLHMVPITKGHGAQSVEVEKLQDQFEKVKQRGLSLDLTNAIFSATAWVLLQIFQFGCLILGIYLAYKKTISIGEVVLYQGFFGAVVGSVTQILNIYPEIAKGMESIKSTGEVLSITDLEHRDDGRRPVDLKGFFEIKEVSFKFPEAESDSVSGVSLSVPASTKVAIVGASGAGKSTLINMLIGFLPPQTGCICVDGMQLSDINPLCYRNQIAIVPQSTVFFDSTVRENLCYGISPLSDQELMAFIKQMEMEDLVLELSQGLGTRVGELGGNLSGGQRQRLSVLRAFLRNPRIVFLDEPTSALDALAEVKIQNAIELLSVNRTVFTVAHRLGTVKNADLIVVMEHGCIVEKGTFQELLSLNGHFTRLHEAYFQTQGADS